MIGSTLLQPLSLLYIINNSCFTNNSKRPAHHNRADPVQTLRDHIVQYSARGSERAKECCLNVGCVVWLSKSVGEVGKISKPMCDECKFCPVSTEGDTSC